MFCVCVSMKINFIQKQNVFYSNPICKNQSGKDFTTTNELQNDIFTKNNLTFAGTPTKTGIRVVKRATRIVKQIPGEILEIPFPEPEIRLITESIPREKIHPQKPQTALQDLPKDFFSLNLFNKFGIKEYKSLTPGQINTIRESLSEKLIQDKNAAITLAEMTHNGLKKEFNQNFTLVLFDKNLSPIGNYFEYLGKKVVFSPIKILLEVDERLTNEFINHLDSAKLSKYAKYLSKNGVSKQEIQTSDKSFIFMVDNYSKEKFLKKLFEQPELDLNSDKIHYKSLSDFVLNKERGCDFNNYILVGDQGMTKEDLLHQYSLDKMFEKNNYSNYSTLTASLLDRPQLAFEKPETLECKQMKFAILDYLNQLGLLK